jgi:hypothetical protein
MGRVVAEVREVRGLKRDKIGCARGARFEARRKSGAQGVRERTDRAPGEIQRTLLGARVEARGARVRD